MVSSFTYNKNEKLKSRKELDKVFTAKKSFLVFPLKVFYLFNETSNDSLIRCGVGVSKKNFSNAVDRNRLKRLMREAYRLNKQPLHETINAKQLSFFVLYIDKVMPQNQAIICEKMKLVIAKLNKKYADELAV
ncbi:MAG: ribonuclease P protein component [Chitinophagaceae bacterium]